MKNSKRIYQKKAEIKARDFDIIVIENREVKIYKELCSVIHNNNSIIK